MEQEKGGFFEGPPQTMFVFGLACGIALSAVGGILLGGTNLSINRAETNSAPIAAAPIANPTPTAPARLTRGPDAADHIRGDLKKAKVILVEYSDFQCPYCGSYTPTLARVVQEYGKDVAVVYRHFPLSFHPQAMPAAEASECAAEQGKFWEYHDALFAQQSTLSEASYGAIADTLKLNRPKFDTCMSSDKYLAKIQKDQSEGAASGVDGTPATFMNGILVPGGAMPFETLKARLDAAIQ